LFGIWGGFGPHTTPHKESSSHQRFEIDDCGVLSAAFGESSIVSFLFSLFSLSLSFEKKKKTRESSALSVAFFLSNNNQRERKRENEEKTELESTSSSSSSP